MASMAVLSCSKSVEQSCFRIAAINCMEKKMEYAHILKANPYHGKDGKFTSKDTAHSFSGEVKAYHGSHAKDFILKGGFKLGSPTSEASGGHAVLGEGIYLTDNKKFAELYGPVLAVKTAKVRLKTVTDEDIYRARTGSTGKKRLEELESQWKGDFFSMPDYAPQVIREHFQKQGYDGVTKKFPGNDKVPTSTHTVIFAPEKFTEITKDGADGLFLTKKIPKMKAKKQEFSQVLKGQPLP